MGKQFFKLVILSSLILHTCKRDSSPEELKSRFYSNKISFDSLLSIIQNNKKLDTLFHNRVDQGLPDMQTSYPKEFGLITKIGIKEISSHGSYCKKNLRWYYIKTNWPSAHPIYFIYDDCDSEETPKDFYKQDKYLNETWGLGESWKMFRFVDTIRNVKL